MQQHLDELGSVVDISEVVVAAYSTYDSRPSERIRTEFVDGTESAFVSSASRPSRLRTFSLESDSNFYEGSCGIA
jgi:hypothetical protein